MNYVCVSVNKEVVNKETFYDKQQALDYLESLHREALEKEREQLRTRLQTSIHNYQHKIEKCVNYLETAEVEGRLTFADKKEVNALLKELSEKKEKKEEDLRQLELKASKQAVSYEAKYNDYKKEPWTEVPQLILHISGIYQRGCIFTVVEEKYYCISAKRSSDTSVYAVMKKLPPQFDKNRIALYMFQEKSELDFEDSEAVIEKDNLDRMQKEVSRIRNQILRDFQNNPMRIRN